MINSLGKEDFSRLLLFRFADLKRQKESVATQDNASAHINRDKISFEADHHRLFSGSNKRALREDGKPEVISIDIDESSGACETTLTSRDVRNEIRRKRPRRDFAYDEREKWSELNSPGPAVDGAFVTGKPDGIDVIQTDAHVIPRASSKRPIGQAMQMDEDSSSTVSFPSLDAVSGNESRRRLARDATQPDQGDSDILPAVESPSSDIDKSAASSQNFPKVDAVHMSSYDNPEDDAASLRGDAFGNLPDRVRLNSI